MSGKKTCPSKPQNLKVENMEVAFNVNQHEVTDTFIAGLYGPAGDAWPILTLTRACYGHLSALWLQERMVEKVNRGKTYILFLFILISMELLTSSAGSYIKGGANYYSVTGCLYIYNHAPIFYSWASESWHFPLTASSAHSVITILYVPILTGINHNLVIAKNKKKEKMYFPAMTLFVIIRSIARVAGKDIFLNKMLLTFLFLPSCRHFIDAIYYWCHKECALRPWIMYSDKLWPWSVIST